MIESRLKVNFRQLCGKFTKELKQLMRNDEYNKFIEEKINLYSIGAFYYTEEESRFQVM